MKKLKIAWISYRPPWPPLKGDQLVTSEQVKCLAREHGDEVELHLLSLYKDEQEVQAVREGLGDCFASMHWYRLPAWKRVLGPPRVLLNGLPMQVNYYTSSALVRSMRQTLQQLQPEVIHTQTIRTGQYIPSGAPLVLDMLDLLSLNMARRAEGEGFPKRQIFSSEARLLRRYEEAMFRRADSVLLVSAKDRQAFGHEDVVVNPNGTFITPEYLARYQDVQPADAFVFHGGMDYFPNVQAALHIARNIWPTVHNQLPRWKMMIVGNRPTPEVKQLHGKDNIVVTGFVPDICETLCGSKVGVYPLLSGTGMQNKVLEAMSVGLPVIGSSYSLQGFPGRSGSEALNADDPAEFARMMIRLGQDATERERIGRLGQQHVWSRYSWGTNAQTLITCWRKAAGE